MNLNDLFNEEKVRLDPHCWDNKKIGNPKTKVKGGVRVNNCVPAESVGEGVRDPNEIGGANSMRQKLGNIIKQAVQDDEVAYNASKLYRELWNIYGGDIDAIIAERSIFELQQLARELVSVGNQGVAEEYELAGVGVAYDLGRRAYRERKTIKDNPYSATKEARKYDEWEKGLAAGRYDRDDADQFRNSVREQGMLENAAPQLSVQQLATISDTALDQAYGYGRSTPGNTFGWQANLKSAAYAKQMIDQGVADIEAISDAIHKGWNTTAQAFVQDPEQFDDTAKLAAAGKLEAKLQQRAQLMKQNYTQLPEDEKEKDRVVARALLQAIRGEQGVAEGQLEANTPDPVVVVQDLKGNILDKINLSVAAQKYKLGQPQNIKNQLAHQNYTKVGNYTIVSPMSGQPQDATTQGVAETELEEVDRRGFLKGLGAAAVAGAAGSAMAAPFKHSQTVDPMTDKVQGGNSTVVSDDGSAKLYIQWNSGVWFDLNQGRAGYSSASSGFPLQTMRIKLGNNPVQEIGGTVSKNFKSIQVGIDPTDTKQLASKILKHSGELRLEVLLADGNKKVFKFTIEPDATSKSVKEQGVAEAELDEKSVSQAQFRTMAGAAHNPEFARKVGISQDVAQEFNQADKKSNYKKLPARATEGKQQKGADYRDPKEVDYDDEYDAMVARVKKLAGLGPMKTVYDPTKRQYRNMPTAVQPKK